MFNVMPSFKISYFWYPLNPLSQYKDRVCNRCLVFDYAIDLEGNTVSLLPGGFVLESACCTLFCVYFYTKLYYITLSIHQHIHYLPKICNLCVTI